MKKTLQKIMRWLAFRRRCSWCGLLVGGNPLARHTTHTICPACLGKMLEPGWDNPTMQSHSPGPAFKRGELVFLGGPVNSRRKQPPPASYEI